MAWLNTSGNILEMKCRLDHYTIRVIMIKDRRLINLGPRVVDVSHELLE